jgi:formylglycine-generating enzyme required for sulfatase activity
MKFVTSIGWFVLFSLGSCAPVSTPLPTLTPPPPTPTLAPVDLAPPVQVGSSLTYLDGSTLVAVPAGPFVMGGGGSENLEHTVTLSDYWIYATKVTNHQYSLCVGQAQCSPPDPIDNLGYTDFGHQNDPVVGVRYDQASAYCAFVNGSLPTEAQWEKLARGPDGNLYPWGNATPSCDLTNFNNCVGTTTSVTNYPKGKSYYGGLDTEGNALEWVGDWYSALYYQISPAQDPAGPDSGHSRVIRSASYKSILDQLPAYTRFFATPGEHRRDLGFRCVVKDPTYFAPACQLASAIAQSDVSSLTVDCPVISITSVSQNCQIGGAIVTFNDDHSADPNASIGGVTGCKLISGTPGSFPLQFKCSSASTAVMNSNCTYLGISNPTCPSHYILNAQTGICEWEGSRTTGLECTFGNYYDPVHHCCVNQAGSGTNSPNCPVGTVYAQDTLGHSVCLPGGSALNVPQQVKSVNPPVCGGYTCSQNQDTCSQRNLVFCSTLCTCLSVGIKCPKK